MNLRDVVRPVGANASPDEYVMPVVVVSGADIGDGTEVDFADDVALSGQITVAAAGTAEQGDDTSGFSRVAVKAHPDNADTVWVGSDGAGDVTASNGFPLNPGEGVVLQGNLNLYWFDVDSNGDVVCWLVVE